MAYIRAFFNHHYDQMDEFWPAANCFNGTHMFTAKAIIAITCNGLLRIKAGLEGKLKSIESLCVPSPMIRNVQMDIGSDLQADLVASDPRSEVCSICNKNSSHHISNPHLQWKWVH